MLSEVKTDTTLLSFPNIKKCNRVNPCIQYDLNYLNDAFGFLRYLEMLV